MEPKKYKGSFINNQFQTSKDFENSWTKTSPADSSDEVMSLSSSVDHVDLACQAAFDAQKKWKKLSLQDRKSALHRLKEVYLAHQELIAETISRETGKPLWETKTEAKALVGKIDITLNHSYELVKEERIENIMPEVEGVIRHKPKGVLAVVGPFNFPAHLPNGHIIPALLLGNTIVFKPSDKTPATGQLLAELFQKAELPAGVFNLVQGGADVGSKLVKHENIHGVLFTGSYNVGLKIKQDTITHYWKSLALEMGGKNSTLIWEDADLKKSIYDTLIGSYLSAGQRCSCTSRIFVHAQIYDAFVDGFYAAAKKLKIGHWKTDSFMGSLIDSDSVDRYIRFQEIAKREGYESLMRGKKLESTGFNGCYVTPSINLASKFNPESLFEKTEIFAPNVVIHKVSDFDQALSQINSTDYGLSASIFTAQENLYHEAVDQLDVGLLNWNRTTNGASSKLPFGGVKKSGNGHPSGHFAVYYCSHPMASLEDPTSFNPDKLYPGIEFP